MVLRLDSRSHFTRDCHECTSPEEADLGEEAIEVADELDLRELERRRLIGGDDWRGERGEIRRSSSPCRSEKESRVSYGPVRPFSLGDAPRLEEGGGK